MNNKEYLKVFHVVDMEDNQEEEDYQIPAAPAPQDKWSEMAIVQTEALKQIAVVLNKFTYHERKMENVSAELKTVSDEVIFLRKRYEAIEEQDPTLIYAELLNRLERIEADLSELKFNVTLKARQIQELNKKLEQRKKPWWKRLCFR